LKRIKKAMTPITRSKNPPTPTPTPIPTVETAVTGAEATAIGLEPPIVRGGINDGGGTWFEINAILSKAKEDPDLELEKVTVLKVDIEKMDTAILIGVHIANGASNRTS
jgi:hypothetical protein